MTPPRALTIAGSDSGGGAGIQADLKTFTAFGVYGMSVVTAVTAQNTLGVQAVFELPIDLIEAQLRSVVSDIGADAAKTGMLASAAVAGRVADPIRELRLSNLVVDPVMVAKGGHPLLAPDARATVRDRLIPLALVVTPNAHEAEALTGRPIRTLADARAAAREIRSAAGQWVVVKGGHLDEAEAIDVVFDGTELRELRAPRVRTANTHGTGCTFSAAIAAGLAKGLDPWAAIDRAKAYVTRAIASSFALGTGHGPTNHMAGLASPW
jgi:hydroxymethylpyrimidine/phosphomethylpyrimidine kinase